jgi:hypothetical protein
LNDEVLLVGRSQPGTARPIVASVGSGSVAMSDSRRTALIAAAVAAAVSAPAGAIAADAGRLFGGGADLVSTDTTRTTLGVRGQEAGLGTAKFSHMPSTAGAVDANASVLSLRAEGVDTRAQGIFFDAPDSQLVKLLNFRLEGREVFSLVPDPAAPGRVILRINGRIEQTP